MNGAMFTANYSLQPTSQENLPELTVLTCAHMTLLLPEEATGDLWPVVKANRNLGLPDDTMTSRRTVLRPSSPILSCSVTALATKGLLEEKGNVVRFLFKKGPSGAKTRAYLEEITHHMV